MNRKSQLISITSAGRLNFPIYKALPQMTNKIALIDEVKGTEGDVTILRETIKYSDKVFAVQDFNFFFEKTTLSKYLINSLRIFT